MSFASSTSSPLMSGSLATAPVTAEELRMDGKRLDRLTLILS
jgi:hypothetical protein